MTIASIRDLPLKGTRVLIRVDFNVPVDEKGMISNDLRIRLALPTIQYAVDQGAKVILMSHFARPKNQDPSYSMAPVAKRVAQLLDRPVILAPAIVGEKVEELVSKMKPGDIVMLENLRFSAAEEHPEIDPSFAKKLASLADYYINDAFAADHRTHSSTVTVADNFVHKRASGLLLEREITFLDKIVHHIKHPFYVIIGGSKVSTKIHALQALLAHSDAFFIAGAMAFTFYKAIKREVGHSFVEPDAVETADEFIKACKAKKVPLFLPLDIRTDKGQIVREIPKEDQGFDIGPLTVDTWGKELQKAKTIFWNGPLGKYELPEYAKGTEAIAHCLSTLTDVTTVAGGGETVDAIYRLHLENKFSYISTGGGALLEYIEKGSLPGIEALRSLQL
jgi:phosphoglycerate kinase